MNMLFLFLSLSAAIAPYISNQKVSSFAEDENGHIWIGTFRGLNKYNMLDYHQYFSSPDGSGIPDNQIQALYRDSRGRLWISTVNGIAYASEKGDFICPAMNVSNRNSTSILESSEGRIYFSTGFNLYCYDENKESVDYAIPLLADAGVPVTCFMSGDNALWAADSYRLRRISLDDMTVTDSIAVDGFPSSFVMAGKGTIIVSGFFSPVRFFDTAGKSFIAAPEAFGQQPLLKEAVINQVLEYRDNCFLINTDKNGLFLYDVENRTVIHEDDNAFPFDVPEFRIRTIYNDSNGNLWFGSVDQGYSVVYGGTDRFNADSYLTSYFRNKSVVSIAKDAGNNVWVATLMDGLYFYDREANEIRHVSLKGIINTKFGNEPDISEVFVSRRGSIWIITSEHIVLECIWTGERLEEVGRHFVWAPICVREDMTGTIWISNCSPDLHMLEPGSRELRSCPVFPEDEFTFISGLLPLNDGRILAAGFMNSLSVIIPCTGAARPLEIAPGSMDSCIRSSVFVPTVAFQDSNSDIWIGTIANGLLKYSYKTAAVEPVEGTACTDISSIQEDSFGNIWIGTQFGLSRYDRQTGKVFNYYDDDGIGGNQFYERASCILDDGTILMGGTHGITAFSPERTGVTRKIPLYFEDLKIHNKIVSASGSDCIDRPMNYGPDIRLKHGQNSFSISFVALDYGEHQRGRYYYKMEGYDKMWIDAHNNREAYYANLPAGRYVFRVKLTGDDNMVISENSLNVRVVPGPWVSWWAICIYAVLLAAVLYMIRRTDSALRAERKKAAMEKMEKEQEQKVNKMNMTFFANVSHEFRTPLTMILGPAGQLAKSDEISGYNKRLLVIIERNAKRMLRLVNQMLDFNKMENDFLRLSVKKVDIVPLLKIIAESFALNAHEKNQTFLTYGLEDSVFIPLDEDKIDKIVFNLLSNAVKFTPSGGTVEMSLDVITREQAREMFALSEKDIDRQWIKISVKDTGNGIPEDQLERIFERYYQLDKPAEGSYNWGTGIGLYYARSLAQIHHGYLKACNRPDGHGALFILILPAGMSSYPEDERAGTDCQSNMLKPKIRETYEPASAGKAADAKTVLVVDDDGEVRNYLKELLSDTYKVICCFDVDSALRSMAETAPDLVLCDVVMPGKDGYELCRRVKENLQMCHIPVILVTAKSTVDDQVEGLHTGADAYVTKPFEPYYLLALIDSSLKNREKVRSILGKATKTEEIEDNVLSTRDNAFMAELYQLMENELSNSELDITRMTELLRISRTKFYYKVKGLTGENPSVFFKRYKLNRAAEMLKDSKYNVSEIADLTGFSTLSHFSTSFKKQFGCSPSEYIKN